MFTYTIKGAGLQTRVNESVRISEDIYIEGVTEVQGPVPGLDVEMWTQYPDTTGNQFQGLAMSFSGDFEDSDRYVLDMTPGTAGVFKFLIRYRMDGGEWTYMGEPGNTRSMNRLVVDPAWVRDAVFYQVFPRVHNAPDVNNDGVLSNDEMHSGFANITADLDRIANLGVKVLWMMPIHPLSTNPDLIKSTDGMFGSPYAPMDFRAINPDYGTREDLQTLIQEAHNRDLKVMIGFVPNHMSPDNVLLDPANPPDNGGYHPDWFEQDEFGNPIPDQEDWWDTVALNYTCEDQEAMRNYVVDSIAYWIDEFGIDAFRMDMAYFQPIDFWEDAMDSLRADHPDFVIVAEAYDMEPQLERAGYTAVYDHIFYKTLLNEVRDGSLDADGFRQRLDETYEQHIAGSLPFQYLENHDEYRSWNAFGGFTPLLAGMTLLDRSAPMLYAGQEFGSTRRIPLFKSWNDVYEYPAMDFTSNSALTKLYPGSHHLSKSE